VTDIIVIDCGLFSTREAAHAYIADTLGFPKHYGANLDALFDCLAELKSGTRIALLNSGLAGERLGEYGKKLLCTFDAAAEENPGIALFYF